MKKVFPRSDKKYRKFSSFDFQSIKAKVWQKALLPSKSHQYSKLEVWSAFAITGLCCGFAAFIIDFLVEELVLFKWEMS